MESRIDHHALCQQFESSEELTIDARKLAERDRDYFDEKQLTAAEEAELKRRGQPVIIKNRIKRKVNAMLGLEKQTRKDPRAFPRTPEDEDAARAATDALRYVCDAARWDDLRSQCAKDLAIEGTCAVKVGTKKVKLKTTLQGTTSLTPAQYGLDPDIKRVPWDRFYYDPHSVAFDFTDATFMGEVVWMDLDVALGKFPDAKDVLESTVAQETASDTYDDTPKWKMWADAKRKRVRLCEHYWKQDGVWYFAILTKGGFVTDPVESPYKGHDGEPECPIKAVSLYVDRDGNRYGEVRTMIGPQDEINKRSSKALHLVTQRQVRVSPSVSDDPREVRKELSRPDGVFIGEKDDVEILPTADMASGNLALLQEAKAEIDLLGPNAALGGKNEADLSGRAILAQQQGGLTELATYLDCIKTLSLAVYRSVWSRVQQHWDGPRWIRVTDDDRNLRFVGINQPITVLQAEAQKMGVTKDTIDKADPQAVAYLETLATMPIAQQVTGIENAVAELDVDIIIDEGIDSPTAQAEQFETITKMLPAFAPAMADPQRAMQIMEFVTQASSLRDKDKLLEILKGDEQGDPAQAAQQAMAAQMQMAQAEAEMQGQIEVQKAQIAASADVESAKIKAQADMEIAQYKAELEAGLQEQKAAMESDFNNRKAEADMQLAERRAMMDHEMKSRVAEQTGETKRKEEEANKADAKDQAQVEAFQQLAEALRELSRPKRKVPIRDEQGFITEMREIFEDAA